MDIVTNALLSNPSVQQSQKALVKDVQAANKTKSKLKKLLV